MRKTKLQKGNAWVGVLIILTFVIALGLALVNDVTKTIAQSKKAGQVVIAQALCDAGIEKAIWRLNTLGNYSGETGLSFATGDLDIEITNIDAQNKSVLATAYVPNKGNPKITRRVRSKIAAVPSNENVAFHYALQAGEGGIYVSGSSDIQGNLYSNGDITFTGGAYRVTGDAFAHGSISPNPNPRVTGQLQTGAPIVPLPDVDIEAWKESASRGGTISGDYSVSGTVEMGPKKITGNFTINKNTSVLNLKGPLYIQGNLNLSGGEVRLSDVFGTSGTVIIVDGTVSIIGGSKFVPNSADGNILVVSTSVANDAIYYSGSATSEALALYAPNGGMTLSGTGEIVATCGKTLNLIGGGEIRYKSGLANANFSAGPGGSWQVREWQIVY